MFVPPEEGEPPPSIPQASHKGDHWPLPDWRITRFNVFFCWHRWDNNLSDTIPVFVEDDVPHLERTLSKFLSRHHLHVHILRLRFAARLDQTLQHLEKFTLSEFQLCGKKPWGRRSAGRLGSGWGRFSAAGRGGWSCRSPAPPTATTWTARRYARSRSGKRKTFVKIFSRKR